MRKRWRFAFGLALLGFIANASLFAYAELTNYSPLSPALNVVSSILCPASLLGGYLFFDLNAHTVTMAVAWMFLGLINSAIYFWVGTLTASFLRKSD